MLTIIVERDSADESTIALDGFSVNGVHFHLHNAIVEIERLYQNLKQILPPHNIFKKSECLLLTTPFAFSCHEALFKNLLTWFLHSERPLPTMRQELSNAYSQK